MAPDGIVVEHGGARFLVRPEAADRMRRFIEALPAVAGAEGARTVKENVVRTVLRTSFETEGLYLKTYHSRGIAEAVKSLLVRSRPMAEWRASRALEAAGIPSVRVLLSGERRSRGVLVEGWLVTEEIPGGEAVVPYLTRHFAGQARDPRRRAFLGALARLLRRFHDAGFAHGDLHGGNLLVLGPPEDPEIRVLDLHTVRTGRRPGPRGRRANLAKLLHSLSTATNRPDRLRFLLDYEGDSPAAGGKSVFPGVLRRIAALERRRLASRGRRCVKQSTAFAHERVGPFLVYRRREVPPFAPLHAVGDHLLSVWRKSEEVLKDSRRSALSRQVLPGWPEHAHAVVKEARCRTAADYLKNALRRPRGMASWRAGNALVVRGVGAARPLALVLQGRWPVRGASWLLMEDLSRLERLDLFVLRRYAKALSSAARAEKTALVRACGRFVGDLHRQGIYHGDLKAVNVFVAPADDGGFAFRLVDYDRVVFGRRVSRRRRIKNLGQLAASVAVLITRSDRLRFFRAYAFDADAAEGERVYARGVLRECARKIVVRMEPIE